MPCMCFRSIFAIMNSQSEHLFVNSMYQSTIYNLIIIDKNSLFKIQSEFLLVIIDISDVYYRLNILVIKDIFLRKTSK